MKTAPKVPKLKTFVFAETRRH